MKLRSISARTAIRIILVSVPLLLVMGLGVTDMSVRQQEADILQHGRSLAKSGAATYGAILQRGLNTGILKWDDVAHPKYTPIKYDVQVAEPRYNSTFDWYTDTFGIQRIEDAMTASDPMLLYAVGGDVTGYIPTTLSAFSHPPSGDAAKDAVDARSKRRFESPMHKAASAWTGEQPLVQEYHRDTGDVSWDVAQPIWLSNPANGEQLHWGAFRVGIRKDKIAEVRNETIIRLTGSFLFFALFLSGFMYLSVKSQMAPLRRLADAADAASMDENAETIRPQPGDADEIAGMAKALKRLQGSLQEAMRRLPATGTVVRHPTEGMEVPR